MVKKASIKGIKGKIKVNEDGTEVYYNDKLINQYKLKTREGSSGYWCCSIENKQLYVHKIVAEAFVKNSKPLTYKLVMHKDGNTANNSYKNLEWGDYKALHQHRIKLKIPGAGVSQLELAYRGSSTISYDEALKIAKRLDEGETARAICKEYNVSEMSIIRIRKRYCKKKVASPRYPKDVKEVVKKLHKKYSKKQISEITGITYHTVLRWCKDL